MDNQVATEQTTPSKGGSRSKRKNPKTTPQPEKEEKSEASVDEGDTITKKVKLDEENSQISDKEQNELNEEETKSVDSIEQAKQEFKFDKPKAWELQPVHVANIWDHSKDMVVYKWVKVREIERPAFRREREKPKTYKCNHPDCGKTFTDNASLKKHMLVHGEKSFVCPYEGCGKKFLDKSKLKRHQLVHTGEKPHKCNICGKMFSLDFNLRTHMRTHTGEKPYICRFPGCNKRFTQSSNLSAHEKIHSMKPEEAEAAQKLLKEED